jgi:hypothetical protein
MGVDISGRKPTTDAGDYFCSNWWGWRPINYICQLAAEQSKLKIDFSYWGSNDGKGLRTQKQCDKLADAIELLISNSTDFNEFLSEDTDRGYICLGSWCEAGTGRFIPSEKQMELNKDYPEGTLLFRPIVMSDGAIVEASHSTSLSRISEFVTFLRGCGGFEIW